jgi:hypothetical protein
MSTPLTHEQKGILCQAARRAFDHQVELGAIGDSADPQDWRREQQIIATGKESLTSCTQDDFAPLLARFAHLEGKDDVALRWELRAQTHPKRVALSKLQEACREAGVDYPGYPETICWTQNKCGIEDATAKQIWRLVFTVRNRRHSQHRSPITNHRLPVANHEEAA